MQIYRVLDRGFQERHVDPVLSQDWKISSFSGGWRLGNQTSGHRWTSGSFFPSLSFYLSRTLSSSQLRVHALHMCGPAWGSCPTIQATRVQDRGRADKQRERKRWRDTEHAQKNNLTFTPKSGKSIY